MRESGCVRRRCRNSVSHCSIRKSTLRTDLTGCWSYAGALHDRPLTYANDPSQGGTNVNGGILIRFAI